MLNITFSDFLLISRSFDKYVLLLLINKMTIDYLFKFLHFMLCEHGKNVWSTSMSSLFCGSSFFSGWCSSRGSSRSWNFFRLGGRLSFWCLFRRSFICLRSDRIRFLSFGLLFTFLFLFFLFFFLVTLKKN